MNAVLKDAVSGVLFLSISIGLTPMVAIPAFAAPGDVNSINNGRDVQSGTYFNTPGSRTTFQNPGGGLWLHSGDLARGLESNINKVPTGNGGTLYFRAPGNIVRLDGNVDVSAVRNGSLYTGNGGKVFVDSAYLFQNGNVFANGANGGLVQFNVGGMTLGDNAKITAQGFGGAGGAINIHSTGTLDFHPGTVIDTSGKIVGTIDTNVISIEGSGINQQGIIRANGLAGTDFKTDNGDATVMAANPNLANNPVPPPISAGSGTGNTAVMQNILFATPPSADFRGGVIRLVATGQTLSTTSVIANADPAILSADEKTALNNKNGQIVSFTEGDLLNRATIEANGALSKNGGTIIITAARRIQNSGAINANGANSVNGVFDANGNGAAGGNGGTIVLAAINAVSNSSTGRIIANGATGAVAQTRSVSTGNGQDANATVTAQAGDGGQGGVIAFSYGAAAGMTNAGVIQANGGVGGRGGSANSFDQEFASNTNPNPTARAVSVGGTGGEGGIGGIVMFSSTANPTGGGNIQVNGGQGGQGGNAWADTQASATAGTPTADSTATRGSGGVGGTSGVIFAPASGFSTGQTFSSKSGGVGSTGSAAFREITIKNGVTTTTTGSTPVTPGTVTGIGNRPLAGTRRNEYIRHEDTAILLTQTNGPGTASNTLTGRLADTQIRTVANPVGAADDSLADAESAANFVIASNAPLALTNDLVNSNVNPLFFNLNSLNIVNNGDLTNGTLWTPGVHLVGEGFHDLELALGGGHISWLANGNITNNQIVISRGLWTGGGIVLAATQDIINNSDFINIAPNKALLSGFTISGPLYESTHAGNTTLKAGRDFINASTGKIATNLIFFDIHPPLNQNPPIDWPKFLNGAQIGATLNLIGTRNFTNNNLIGADALTYRNGQTGADNPALTIGGIVTGRAKTGIFTNTGTITANGDAFFSPNESDGPRFTTNTFPRTTSFAGTVSAP